MMIRNNMRVTLYIMIKPTTEKMGKKRIIKAHEDALKPESPSGKWNSFVR